VEKTRLAILGTLLLLAGCSSSVNTATYATLTEAKTAGAVDKGLVPSTLPEGAYELRAAYAVNGPERWGLFNFREPDAEALRSILQPEEISFAGTEMEIPGRIEWWPVILRGTLDADRIQATGLRAYRARNGGLVFAVNWNQGRAYYWTHGTHGTD
jgi:hypothetical protein